MPSLGPLKDALQSLGGVAEYWRFVVLVGGRHFIASFGTGLNKVKCEAANAMDANASTRASLGHKPIELKVR